MRFATNTTPNPDGVATIIKSIETVGKLNLTECERQYFIDKDIEHKVDSILEKLRPLITKHIKQYYKDDIDAVDVADIVFTTKVYSKFKKLIAQRDEKQVGVDGIVQSVEAVGRINIPIIVNEKMEVIDGQHSGSAYKYLDMPITYVMQDGLTLEHCMALNSIRNGWKQRDKIKSFGTEGATVYTEDFGNLNKLMEKYPNLADKIFATATNKTNTFSTRSINSASLVITEEQYKNADNVLKFINKFHDWYLENKSVLGLKGGPAYLEQAMAYAYMMDSVDNSRVMQVVKTRWATMGNVSVGNVEASIDLLDRWYNYNLSSDKRVQIKNNYLTEKELARKNISHNHKQTVFVNSNTGKQKINVFDIRKTKNKYEKFV